MLLTMNHDTHETPLAWRCMDGGDGDGDGKTGLCWCWLARDNTENCSAAGAWSLSPPSQLWVSTC